MIFIKFAITAFTLLGFKLECTNSEAEGSWKTTVMDHGYMISLSSDTKKSLMDLLGGGAKKSRSGITTHQEAISRMEVIQKMEKMAYDSQKEVIKIIDEHHIKHEYDSLWITNQIFLKSFDLELLKKLKKAGGVRKMAVSNVTERPHGNYLGTKKGGAGEKPEPRMASMDIQWNIEQICAPRVWAQGYDGKGVRLGFISGGVKANHDQLQGKWTYTEYGWYDATGQNAALPIEDFYYSGFGTMRVGEAMADGGYGTAPGSRYVVCRACLGTGCQEAAYYKCVQFMLCPWDRKGNKNCSYAPHAVNLGLDVFTDKWDFESTITALDAAGIVVVTEAEYWPNTQDITKICGTVRQPCTHEKALCVGATSKTRRYVVTRCGPVKDKPDLIKPDVLAPGYGFTGCFTCPQHQQHRGDCYHFNHDYTSGAGHVMGIIALLLDRRPGLSVDELKKAIRESTEEVANDHEKAPHECGGKKDEPRPNFIKGYGFVNACLAIESLPCKESEVHPTGQSSGGKPAHKPATLTTLKPMDKPTDNAQADER